MMKRNILISFINNRFLYIFTLGYLIKFISKKKKLVFGLTTLKKKFFKIEDVVEFHLTLTNIVMLITENYEEGGYYCYCDRYYDC